MVSNAISIRRGGGRGSGDTCNNNLGAVET